MLAVLMDYDYVFTENGLVAFKDESLLGMRLNTLLLQAALKYVIQFI
jgi:hypothetical protein